MMVFARSAFVVQKVDARPPAQEHAGQLLFDVWDVIIVTSRKDPKIFQHVSKIV
jgi:hypothetical protein